MKRLSRLLLVWIALALSFSGFAFAGIPQGGATTTVFARTSAGTDMGADANSTTFESAAPACTDMPSAHGSSVAGVDCTASGACTSPACNIVAGAPPSGSSLGGLAVHASPAIGHSLPPVGFYTDAPERPPRPLA